MRQPKRIFIVGHPGAGKALLAKTVAEKLGWQYIDADFGLESRIGRPLTEILDKQGKAAFLNCQSEILAALHSKGYIVVTTDASIVCSKKNRELLATEFVVYLKVSTSVQIERSTARPSNQLLPLASLEKFLDNLHNERDELYEQVAKLSINSDDNALEKHASIITNKVQTKEERPMVVVASDKQDLVVFHKILHTPVHLTIQQAKCLKLLAQGKSSKNIAQLLNISYRTVEGRIATMMQVLGCSSSKELITLYLNQP
jgi:shikimate kinase